MKRNFDQLKQFLEYNYPQLRNKIKGENFPPPPFAVYIQHAYSFIQMFAFLCVFFGDSIWNMMLGGVPQWYTDLKQNPTMAFVMIFFVAPSLINSFITTGAFEVELDGQLVYSKIETGRLPTGLDMITAFENAGLDRLISS